MSHYRDAIGKKYGGHTTACRTKWFGLLWALSAVAALTAGADSPVVRIAGQPAASAAGQSVTLLPNGKWLRVGGTVAAGLSAAIRVINGATETSFGASLHTARTGHTATVLPDGSVLIFGGRGVDRNPIELAELIDPIAGTVTDLLASGLGARADHSAVLLTNGQVLIAGGIGANGEVLNSAQLWDSRTRLAVSASPQLQVARHAQEAELLASGEGLVWGGINAANEALNHGELFNPNTQAFEGPMGSADARITASRRPLPLVEDTLPAHNSTDVPLDTVIGIRFSKPLPIAQLNGKTITLVGPSGAVSGSVVGAERGMLVFFRPAQPLLPGTIYTLFVNGIRDEIDQELPLTSVRLTTHRISATDPTSNAGRATASTGARNGTTGGAHDAAGNSNVSSNSPNASAARLNPTRTAEKDKKVTFDDLREDWRPRLENRHGAWRVLGFSDDPPLVSVSTAAAVATANKTAIAGHVHRLNGRPIEGVSVSAGNVSTTTDAQGRFVLVDVAPGEQLLRVDGRNVFNNGRHYTEHYFHVLAKKGQTVSLGGPLFLPRVDPATEVPISSPADHDIVLTHAAIPGLEVRIPKGAVLRERDGKIVTSVSITPLPMDRAPDPPPVRFSVYFTLQPGGAYVDGDPSKAIKIIYPNYDGLEAGTRVDFWNYNPLAGGWQVYGHGKVSANRKQIIPDESVGFRQIMSFSFGIGPNGPPPNNGANPGGGPGGGGGGGGSGAGGGSGGGGPGTPAPNLQSCKAGDPVDCATGIFSYTVTDLAVRDVMSIGATRMYRTNDNQSHLFGVGANLSYSMWLYMPPDKPTYSEVYLITADGGRVKYLPVSGQPGLPLKNTDSPTEFNGSILTFNNVPHTWELRLRNGMLYRFFAFSSNHLMSITDRNGNEITITVVNTTNETATGPMITQVRSPNGRYIKFFYDAQYRIVDATDNSGRTTHYVYDTVGRLANVTDANGFMEIYNYDAITNNMNLVMDKRNNSAIQNEYYSDGRVKNQTLADGAVWQFTYALDSNGLVKQTTVTDPRNYMRQLTFNAAGYPTKTILAMGQPEEQTYTIVRNTSNYPALITDPLGRQTLYGYNGSGDLTSVTALHGTPGVVTYTMTYEPNYHQLTSITDPLGHTATMRIGAFGNTTGATDALGHMTTLNYNGQGLPVIIKDALDHAVQFAFGAGGDLEKITDPLFRETKFFSDPLGRFRSTIDPLGNMTQYEYDSMDRLAKVTNAIGGVTDLAYDQNGNLLTAKDPKNVVHTFTYDLRDRVHTYKDPAVQTATYNFDGMGNLTSVLDRKSQLTNIQYDPLNRPKLVTFADNSTISIIWDAGSRPRQFIDSVNGTISRDYDLLDRLTQETTPQGQVNYTYDNAGRRATMTVAGLPTVQYTFDDANHLTQVAQGTTTLGFGYDEANRRTSITWPNGIVGTFTFDNASQLMNIAYAKGATTVGTLGYSYDNGGRRTSVTGTLAGFVMPQALGSLSYDDSNRLTSAGGAGLSYDNNGNLTTFGATSYTWNVRNQLIGTSGGGASFSYDALRRRVGATVNGSSTQYLYDGLNPVTLSGNLQLASQNLDEVFVQVGSGGTTSYLRDGLNSATAVTNGSGAVTGNYSYSPYGDSVRTGTESTPLQYTGRDNDGATGLYYYRARYYSPALGRFISEDPIGLEGGSNVYAYVGGDPISLSDPFGLLSVKLSWFEGVGGSLTVGYDGGKWFVMGGVGFGIGAGFKVYPNGSFPRPSDGSQLCGNEGYLGFSGSFGATVGPASAEWKGQTGGIVGYSPDGKLQFKFTESGGFDWSLRAKSAWGLSLGGGGTATAGIAW